MKLDTQIACMIATCMGLGGLRFGMLGSGSITSLATCVLWGVLIPITSLNLKILIAAIAVGVGFWACAHYIKVHGDQDHSCITIDEFAGQTIALIGSTTFLGILLSFAIFRILDIKKPWLIGTIDRDMPHKYGIMCDDILAGLVSAALVFILLMDI